jgi:aryl-alcohol dehydrogenase-like predicted oxidoreductase
MHIASPLTSTLTKSTAYGTTKPDEERFKVLDKLYQDGLFFWDTADVYADSEDLLGTCANRRGILIAAFGRWQHFFCKGNWFRHNPCKREKIFLATKFALSFKDDWSSIKTDSTPEYCREACEKSLERLGVESIDLYYCHRVDQKTPIEKTVEEMKKLKQEGKIKYLGLSEVSSETLRRACKVEHISAVQIE